MEVRGLRARVLELERERELARIRRRDTAKRLEEARRSLSKENVTSRASSSVARESREKEEAIVPSHRLADARGAAEAAERANESRRDVLKTIREQMTRQSKRAYLLRTEVSRIERKIERTRERNDELSREAERLKTTTRARDLEKEVCARALEHESRERAEEIANLRQSFQKREEQLRKLNNEIALGEKRFEAIRAGLEEDSRETLKRADAAARDVRDAETFETSVATTLSAYKDRERALKRRVEDSSELLSKLRGDVDVKRRQVATLETRLRDVRCRRETKIERARDARAAIRSKRDALSRRRRLVSDLESELDVVNARLSAAATEESRPATTSGSEEDESDAGETRLRTCRTAARDLERDVEIQERRCDEANRAVARLSTRLELLHRDREVTLRRRREIEAEISRAIRSDESARARLQERRDSRRRAAERASTNRDERTDAAEALAHTAEKLERTLLERASEVDDLVLLEKRARRDRDEEIDALRSKIAVQTARQVELAREIASAENHLGSSQERRRDLEREIERLEATLRTDNERFDGERRDRLAELNDARSRLRSTNDAIDEETERGTIESARRDTADIVARCDVLERTIERGEREIVEIRLDSRRAQEERRETSARREESLAELRRLRVDVRNAEKRLETATRANVDLHRQIEAANEEVDSIRSRTNAAIDARRTCEARVESAKAISVELISELERKKNRFEIDTVSASRDRARLQRVAIETIERVARLSNEVRARTASIREIRNTIARERNETADEAAAAEATRRTLREEIWRRRETADETNARVAAIRLSLDERRSDVEEAKAERDLLEQRLQTLTADRKSVRERIETALVEEARARGRVAGARDTLRARDDALASLQRRTDTKREIQDTLRRQVRSAEHHRKLLRASVERGEAKCDELRASIANAKEGFGASRIGRAFE